MDDLRPRVDDTAELTLVGRPRRGGVGTWVLAFAALFVASAVWSLATPLGSGPDEPTHVVRAAAAVRGQLLGAPDPQAGHLGAFRQVRVPESFASLQGVSRCYRGRPTVAAGCAPPVSHARRTVTTGTYVARYPPLYYLVVGLPSRWLVGPAGMYAMRLVSAALSAAMLALAICALRRSGRTPWLAAALAVATTPFVLYLGSTVNPNGLELSSAVAAWAAAAGLCTVEDPADAGPLVGNLALPVAVLLLVRQLAPLWVIAIALAVLLLGPGVGTWGLRRRSALRAWLAVDAVALALAVAWDVYANPFVVLPGTAIPSGLSHLRVAVILLGQTPLEMMQDIGIFGSLDTPAPAVTRAVWITGFGVLVLLGLALARWRGWIAGVGLTVAWIAVPVVGGSLQAGRYGLIGQGRDFLALGLGVGFVFAAAAGARLGTGWAARRVVRVLLAALAVAQLAAVYWAMRRYTVGLNGHTANAFKTVPGGWAPPVSGVALMALFCVAIAGWAVLADRATGAPAGWPGTVRGRHRRRR